MRWGDEGYYVNAARVILGLHNPSGHSYSGPNLTAGIDPNREHPPLGKVLIAGSMRLFGDNGYGWRAISVFLGLASILLLYLIVSKLSRDRWLGVLAATIFSFDNLVFVQSRMGTLETPVLTLLLLAVFFWARDRPLLAGMICGLAASVKITAVQGVLALLLLTLLGPLTALWQRRRPALSSLLAPGCLMLGFVSAWLVSLGLLDLLVTAFPSPLAHIHYILSYGLQGKRNLVVSLKGQSAPWQWLLGQGGMNNLHLFSDQLYSNGTVSKTLVANFRNALSPVILVTIVPAFLYSVWQAISKQERLSQWIVAWVLTTYLLLYPLYIFEHRIMYIYYFLLTMPAIAVAIAQALKHPRLPRWLPAVYIYCLLAAFIAAWPFPHTF